MLKIRVENVAAFEAIKTNKNDAAKKRNHHNRCLKNQSPPSHLDTIKQYPRRLQILLINKTPRNRKKNSSIDHFQSLAHKYKFEIRLVYIPLKIL